MHGRPVASLIDKRIDPPKINNDAACCYFPKQHAAFLLEQDLKLLHVAKPLTGILPRRQRKLPSALNVVKWQPSFPAGINQTILAFSGCLQ